MRYRYLIALAALFFLAPLAGHAQGACPSGAPVSGNHCYFASTSSGSDANAGTSEAAPCNHIPPNMPGISGTCAAITVAAGDWVVLKGCDIWDFSTIHQWQPNVSGTSGNPLGWGGFDQTWYNTANCPSGWNRPIFSGSGTWPGLNPASGSSYFIDLHAYQNYWRIAYVEFEDSYWELNSTNYGGSGGYVNASGGLTGVEFDHNFLHAYLFKLDTDCTVSGTNYPCGEPVGFDIEGTIGSTHIHDDVFYGGDSIGTCTAGQGCPSAGATVYNYGEPIIGSTTGSMDHNYFGYADNCWVGSMAIVLENTFDHCGTFAATANSNHTNIFENNSDPTGGTVFCNNLLMHDGTVTRSATSQLTPGTGDTSYFCNNVLVDQLAGYSGSQLPFNCASPGGGTCFAFNNTIEAGSDSAGVGPSQAPPSLQYASCNPADACTSRYNHIISTASGIQCVGGVGCTISILGDLTQTQTAANAQLYTLANMFAPQNSSGSTIAAGYSPSALATLCTAVAGVNATAGTLCQSSTSAGVQLVTTPYYQVGAANVTPVARLLTGATNNDAGAFQFSGAPPPTGSPVPVTSGVMY